MLRSAMLFAALSCASLVQAADDPLTYEGDLLQGVDAVITKGCCRQRRRLPSIHCKASLRQLQGRLWRQHPLTVTV